MAGENQQPFQTPVAHARNIFEGINQNIVDLSQDVVKLYEMNQNTESKMETVALKMDTLLEKVEAIYAALYQPMPERPANEIPEGSPNDPGEGEGSENE